MKVLTICGSMRFEKQMIEIASELEFKGYCVLQCVYFDKNKNVAKEEYQNLEKAHLKKIDLSDGIYVVNCGGYIGESTQKEIDYALKSGKEVIYLEPNGRKNDNN